LFLYNLALITHDATKSVNPSITMRKSTHEFPSLSHDEYGAPLGGPSGRWSSAKKPKHEGHREYSEFEWTKWLPDKDFFTA